MTDRINLTELRQRAETGDTHPELYDTGWIDINITTLLALIDAADAAEAISGSLVDPDADEEKLLEALARFDHT